MSSNNANLLNNQSFVILLFMAIGLVVYSEINNDLVWLVVAFACVFYVVFREAYNIKPLKNYKLVVFYKEKDGTSQQEYHLIPSRSEHIARRELLDTYLKQDCHVINIVCDSLGEHEINEY